MKYIRTSHSSCLMVTHNIEEAIFIADEISVLSKQEDQAAKLKQVCLIDVPHEERSSWRFSADYVDIMKQVTDAVENG